MTTLCCTWCGGLLRRYRKLDYDARPRWWHSCVDCGEAGWEYGSDRDAWQRRMRRERDEVTV